MRTTRVPEWCRHCWISFASLSINIFCRIKILGCPGQRANGAGSTKMKLCVGNMCRVQRLRRQQYMRCLLFVSWEGIQFQTSGVFSAPCELLSFAPPYDVDMACWVHLGTEFSWMERLTHFVLRAARVDSLKSCSNWISWNCSKCSLFCSPQAKNLNNHYMFLLSMIDSFTVNIIHTRKASPGHAIKGKYPSI